MLVAGKERLVFLMKREEMVKTYQLMCDARRLELPFSAFPLLSPHHFPSALPFRRPILAQNIILKNIIFHAATLSETQLIYTTKLLL